MDWLVLLIAVVVVERLLSGEWITRQHGLKRWLVGLGSLALPAAIYLLLFGSRATAGGVVLAVILAFSIQAVLFAFYLCARS